MMSISGKTDIDWADFAARVAPVEDRKVLHDKIGQVLTEGGRCPQYSQRRGECGQ